VIRRERTYTAQLNVRMRPDVLAYYMAQADVRNSTPSTIARRVLEREALRELQRKDDGKEASLQCHDTSLV
jgi:hypothetical protein